MYYFDPDVNGFIPSGWKDDGTYDNLVWPARAVLITLEQYQEFSGQPPQGKLLGHDADGYPVWVDRPAPTPEQVLASQSAILVGLKTEAEAQKTALTNRIGVLNDSIELEMATPEEEAELPVRVAQLKAWKTYAVLLGRVTTQAGWPPEVVWPTKPSSGMDLTTNSSQQTA